MLVCCIRKKNQACQEFEKKKDWYNLFSQFSVSLLLQRQQNNLEKFDWIQPHGSQRIFRYACHKTNTTHSPLTYDSWLRLICPCSRRLRRTSSSCGRTRRSRTGTPPPGTEASVAPSCGCSAPWTRPTCPCSRGRRRSSRGLGCTPSCCSGTRAGRRWVPSISPRRLRPRSRRRRRTQRWGPRTSRCGTGNLWRGTPWHLVGRRSTSTRMTKSLS